MLQETTTAAAICADCAHGHHERPRVGPCSCPCHAESRPDLRTLMTVSAVRAALDLSDVEILDPADLTTLPGKDINLLFASCRAWLKKRWAV